MINQYIYNVRTQTYNSIIGCNFLVRTVNPLCTQSEVYGRIKHYGIYISIKNTSYVFYKSKPEGVKKVTFSIKLKPNLSLIEIHDAILSILPIKMKSYYTMDNDEITELKKNIYDVKRERGDSS